MDCEHSEQDREGSIKVQCSEYKVQLMNNYFLNVNKSRIGEIFVHSPPQGEGPARATRGGMSNANSGWGKQ